MMASSTPLVQRVLAPDGSVLTLSNLPGEDTRRWVASRKVLVLPAVRGGLPSMGEVWPRYLLTTEEFLSWQVQADRNGLHGLRATRVQQYRGRRRAGSHDGHGRRTRSGPG